MYEVSEEPFPFWGAQTSTKGGRDPLAVQNSSVIIYTDMVPGITNVTLRVRYNGLFCWLLTLIAKRVGKSLIDDILTQIKYLRRGEYLLSHIMTENYPFVTGVSGSIFAAKFTSQTIIDLANGADYVQEKEMYWKNKMGIFGQYYMGVMQQLKLIYSPSETHNTYRVTDIGVKFYDCINDYITTGVADLFWDCIRQGTVERNQLRQMKKLALHLIDNKTELELYRGLLQTADRESLTGEKTYHRLNTIKLLLNFINRRHIKRSNLVESFLQANFINVLENFTEIIKKQEQDSDEQVAWFMYELNELSHTAYEMYHYAIMEKLDNEPQPLDRVINRIRREFEVYKEQASNENSIYILYRNSRLAENSGDAVFESSRLIEKLYSAITPIEDKLYSFANSHDYYINHPGFGPLLLKKLRHDGTKPEDWKFNEENLLLAINDHQRSSYSKSNLGQGLVHNYMVDDGMIWKLRGSVQTRTTPRLQNVLLYAEDLKWIQRDGEYYVLTEDGQKLLGND